VTETWVRRSARTILVDPAGRVLLLASGERWFTPGGGIEAGETEPEAASRELWEETGLRVPPDRLGPVVARTSGYAALDWARGMFADAFYFVRAPAGFEVDTSGYEEVERATVTGHRWWTVDEVLASAAQVVPWDLGPLLRDLLAGRIPPEPVQLPWHH
jgi:8-oxo-dGTP pyrophosphatase MutT (NUDIX family)